MIQQVCGNCDGQGVVNRSPCVTCRGKGSTNGTVKEQIDIPKGVDNGVNLRVGKKGNAGDGGPSGDLIIHIKVRPHPVFKREGSNILSDVHISVSQAILGCDISVPTLLGDKILTVRPGTQHDDQFRIDRAGVTKLPPNHHQRGNHIVTFKVKMPKSLTPQMRQLMEQF
jgi:molecular chaperone DnaJ